MALASNSSISTFFKSGLQKSLLLLIAAVVLLLLLMADVVSGNTPYSNKWLISLLLRLDGRIIWSSDNVDVDEDGDW